MLEIKAGPTISDCISEEHKTRVGFYVNNDRSFLNNDWAKQTSETRPPLETILTVFEMLEMIDYLEPEFKTKGVRLQSVIEEWLIDRVR